MKTVISAVLFVIISTINAQVSQEWVASYNGPGNNGDMANAIAVDGSGNVYVTGTSVGSGTFYDYCTIKYNSSGAMLWVSRYNGPGNGDDTPSSIAVDLLGNVYVTGMSIGNGTYLDYATIKYNSSGVEQWVRRYNGPAGNNSDRASSIAVDGSGNVYVTGFSAGLGTMADYATIKYNTSGVEQWVVRYNGPGFDIDGASSIAVDAFGNVYVTGSSANGTFNSTLDYATIKYSSAGNMTWVARYNGPGNNADEAFLITIDSAQNVYVTGSSVGNGTFQDYATIKYNSFGAEQWVARYNGPGNNLDEANSIIVDNSGNVYVTGFSDGSGTSGDYATVKYNPLGVEQWVQRYNGLGNSTDWARSIALDGSNNVYVTGRSLNAPINSDYATIKYNSAGVQQWVQRYHGGWGHDYASSLAVDASGNIYVTGESAAAIGPGSDYATIKYSQTATSVGQISSETLENYSLSQNYPNPFNPTTKIQFAIPVSGFVSLSVFDVLGKEVDVLVNENKAAGNYEVDFDASKLTGGIYFYKLQTGNFTTTKKMVLMK